MSHNDVLREKVGTTTGWCVRRILAVYDRASAEEFDEGARWYPRALGTCERLSARHGEPLDGVAAVVASLSPRMRWAKNVVAADVFLGGGNPVALGASVRAARRVSGSVDPLGALRGPKVSRFAANILGDDQVVTVDVWAARVALPDRDYASHERMLQWVGVYEAVEYAYQLAARARGVSPAVMQAVCWVVARGSAL